MLGGGCGSDDGGQELEDALVGDLMAQAGPGNLDEQQARCAVRQTIDQVGADDLRAAGAPDDMQVNRLAQDDQAKVVDAFLGCVDARQAVVDRITSQAPVSEESAGCIADDLEQSGVIRDAVTVAVASGNAGADALQQQVQGEIMPSLVKCLSPADLQAVLSSVSGG